MSTSSYLLDGGEDGVCCGVDKPLTPDPTTGELPMCGRPATRRLWSSQGGQLTYDACDEHARDQVRNNARVINRIEFIGVRG